MIRIAIIGYGKIARDQHHPAIAADPNFELVAAVSTQSLDLPGVRCFTDYRTMLAERLELDAVAICTPPSVRYGIALDCLAGGLDLLLEKPPATTLGEAEDIARQADAAGRVLFTTWHAQFNPAVTAAAALLAGRRIAAMEIAWKEDVRKWHPGQRWVWQPGGFGVFDPGINALSIAAAIFPGALLVADAELRFPDNADTPIAAMLRLASPAADGPLTAEFDWDQRSGETWTIALRTSDGTSVRLLDGGARLEVDGAERSAAGAGEYPAIYARFAELVAQRRSEVDLRPLRLVADSLLRARRVAAPPFVE